MALALRGGSAKGLAHLGVLQGFRWLRGFTVPLGR